MLSFDGTPSSFVALEWAAHRASLRDSSIEILMGGSGLLPIDFGADAALIRAERRIYEIAPGCPVTSVRWSSRMPARMYERTRDANLIVIGASRVRRLRATVPSWPHPRLSEHCRMPVVMVPDVWEPRSGPIIIGLDDDDSSLAALEFAAAEAAAAENPLSVVHAWEMPSPRFEGSITLLASPISVRAEHRMLLRVAAQRVWDSVPGVMVDQQLIQDDPVAALLQGAGSASMLVLGTQHRGLLAGASLGPIGQAVLRESPVPVCVVPRR
ncbi:MAG: universal stress protein [Microbacterium sp.]